MGKKKGNKRGGGDDFWEEAGEVFLLKQSKGCAQSEDEDSKSIASAKNAFANMQIDAAGSDDAPVAKPNSAPQPADKDEEDYGGLISAIKSSNKGGRKGKKGRKGKEELDWDAIKAEMAQPIGGPALDDKVIAVGDMDDEFRYEGRSGKVEKKDDSAQANGTSSPAPESEAAAANEDNSSKLMSKKEKEKLKKEKEKAKKKTQDQAKKAASAGADAAVPDADSKHDEAPAPAAAADEEEDDKREGEDGASAADKKKKKKKKKTTVAEASAAPPFVGGAGRKPNAALSALQARIAAQKKAEEEARLAEEEARRAEEEAERLEKEEAELKELERQRKKEKEKAKREQLKREGKLLTPKQKAEKQAAEARLQAMIKSGAVKVEGLAKFRSSCSSAGDEEKKLTNVVDTRSKKKKQQQGGPRNQIVEVALFSSAEEEPGKGIPQKEQPAAAAIAVETSNEEPTAEEAEDVKDDWEADSEDEDVKDDWEVQSDGEKEAKESVQEAGRKARSVKSECNAGVKKTASSKRQQATAAATATAAAKAKAETAKVTESDGDDDDDDSENDLEDELTSAQRQAAERRAEAARRREEQHKQALAARSKDNLRSPICCILGHVDTGKTKLLDRIRQTNVQEGEAGGITQQIGATYFPVETLQQKIAPIDPEGKQEFKTPGLLVIDTPGHESFTNLRTRGSSLCNIAILVVDIMHGLEQQTLESIRLLRDKKTPFIVALNKVDRLYGWKVTPDGAFRNSLKQQDRATQNEFEERAKKVMVAFAEQGLNAVLYYNNKNFSKNASLVPTSAHTGEGIPDMLQLLVNLTQERMSERLMYLSELECTVLEVKVIEGLGTTIDVVLSNGTMKEGDKIVVCGLNGPIVTQVRALLTPQPMKEMRIKGAYVHHKEVKAALGVKIAAPDLEKAIAGSRLLVCGPDDDEEDLKEEVMSDLTGLLDSVDKSGKGVCVQASTLGSLEALLEFLRTSKIPVSGINIGPVYKKDVMRASTIIEKARELACILCFDVPVDKEAERLAEEVGVRLFKADIIYHLFDAFTKYNAEVVENKKKDAAPTAVWPARLKILACFARRDPIIIGAELLDNVDLRVGTPLCVIKNRDVIDLGRVTSLEVNHKAMQAVSKREAGAGVAVKIESNSDQKLFGRHFDDTDIVYSKISRASLDSLKEHFWSDVSLDQKKLLKSLKGVFNIP